MRLIFALALVAAAFGPAVAQNAEAPAGAAACTGCHAAKAGVDSPVPRLAGRNQSDIIAAMQAFRNGGRPATVMDRIAKGFTDDEMKAIAEWYAAQRQ